MTTGQVPTAWLRSLPASSDEARSTNYPLSQTESLVLGRDPRCQIVVEPLRYRSVSRRHAEVGPVLSDPRGVRYWQVCDLSSANGTFVNGQSVQGCQVLHSGDRVMLGQSGPEFVFEQAATAIAPLPAVASPAAPASVVSRRSGPRSAIPRFKRDRGESVSLTQLFPILSTGRQLLHKAYLVSAIVTVAFVVLLFLAVGEPKLFNLLLAAYLSGAAYLFIYQLCGKHKPGWLLIGSAVTTMLILVSPLLSVFLLVFREWLPGRLPTDLQTIGFPVLLLRMFFGAGLMEELLKALPVLGVWALGRVRSRWGDRVGVREPLDGILLGAASAVGFTLMETLGQYVPEVYNSTLRIGEDAAQLASLQLLIPRVLGSVAGHLAYSGYLGYFIGLSVLRPRQWWLILGVGYLTAAVLHTLWNTAGVLSPVLLALVGVLSYAFLAAAILKARELSPNRSQNFATRFYK